MDDPLAADTFPLPTTLGHGSDLRHDRFCHPVPVGVVRLWHGHVADGCEEAAEQPLDAPAVAADTKMRLQRGRFALRQFIEEDKLLLHHLARWQ